MPDQVLRDQDVDVILPIVDLELMPHKTREDGGSARHCSDGRRFLAGLGARDWEPSASFSFSSTTKLLEREVGYHGRMKYGTILGPKSI